MKAIILAAGYATRLRPLTESIPKPLLPVGGRPIVDYLVDAIEGVSEVAELHLITNAKFAGAFARWAKDRAGRLSVTVHDDGTRSNEDRLGAIGDIRFTIERAGIHNDDLLVVGGDNLFDFELSSFVAFWKRKGQASAIALYDCKSLDLARQYSTASLGDDERITSFVEKPQHPTTTCVGTANYLYHREHVELIDTYLTEGGSPDAPGHLIAWLYKRAPVYGYRFEGSWLDIGNHQELLRADNLLRKRLGMPERAEYSIERALHTSP